MVLGNYPAQDPERSQWDQYGITPRGHDVPALAWIHPFGDGNGRTARLIEFQLLLAAGFPQPACHLLSNHYMKTRSRYYQVLREASQADGYPLWRFASYAIQGLVEQLGETIAMIQQHQLGLAWMSLVGGVHVGQTADAVSRRQQLLLALPPDGTYTPIAVLRRLSPEIAARYANRTTKTLTRDVNALEKVGLIVKRVNEIRPNFDPLFAFLPLRVDPRDSVERELGLAAASRPLRDEAAKELRKRPASRSQPGAPPAPQAGSPANTGT